jgi:hypothetical protein
MTSLQETFGPVIHSYTREQAIDDGVLVDLTQIPVTKEHYKVPVACTAAVWALITPPRKDMTGILHDVLWMSRMSGTLSADETTKIFKVKIGRKLHTFKMIVGPGAAGECVATIMLPNED